MDAGDWIALGGTVLALVIQSIGMAMFISRMAGKIETNTRDIAALSTGKLSAEVGSGLQAQVSRLERNDAECEGKMAGMRQEAADRIERLGARLSAHEQTQSSQNTALTSALTRLEATMEGMRDAINRLAQDREPPPPAQAPDFLTQLQQFAAVQKMLKGVAT